MLGNRKPPTTGLGKMIRDLVHRVRKRASKFKGNGRLVRESKKIKNHDTSTAEFEFPGR